MDNWYLTNLACPRDRSELALKGGTLACQQHHEYHVVDGIPVMLLDDVEQTLAVAGASLRQANEEPDVSGLYLDSLGISLEQKNRVQVLAGRKNGEVDPVVAVLIAATNGLMYKSLVGGLRRYPIPNFPLSEGGGQTLLDVGCNWGRWCIGAAKKGWQVVGVDPSLGAVMAARRVARAMDLRIRFVVADARFLPFRANQFDAVFSYSVLQHLAKHAVRTSLTEIARVLKDSGTSLVQMPNMLGVRSLYHQTRRRFRAARDFEVRYWSVRELQETFSKAVGPTTISVDCFGGLGIQSADWDLMPPVGKLVITGSETLKTFTRILPFLKYFADSLYVKSIKALGLLPPVGLAVRRVDP